MKKAITILLFLSLLLSVSGCSHPTIFSSYREIENVEMVSSIGVDKCEMGVKVTSGSGIGQQEEEPHIFEGAGTTMAAALEMLKKLPLGKETLLSHTERVFFSEDIAKNGMGEHLDLLARTKYMRLDTFIYIVKGGGAGQLMRDAASKRSSATDMMRHLEKYVKTIGNSYTFTIEDVLASLAIRGSALIMAVEGVERKAYSEEDSALMIVPVGLAVINKGSFAGYLSDDESFGAMLIMGLVESDSMDIHLDDFIVTIEMTGVKTDFKPVFEKNELKRVDIDMQVQANIISISKQVKIIDEGFQKKLSGALAEVELGRALAALKRTKEDNIDFMALGGIIERKAPIKFAKMNKSWEEILPELEFRVSVSPTIRRTYDIDDPLSVTGKKEATVWEKLTK